MIDCGRWWEWKDFFGLCKWEFMVKICSLLMEVKEIVETVEMYVSGFLMNIYLFIKTAKYKEGVRKDVTKVFWVINYRTDRPPFSSDFVPCDFFLLQILKMSLNR